ncbi:IS3 family transposase [Oligella ureolytica]
MVHYSDERKEAILSKLLPPYNLSVYELAREEGISKTTLYNWRKEANLKGTPHARTKT